MITPTIELLLKNILEIMYTTGKHDQLLNIDTQKETVAENLRIILLILNKL